MIYEKALVCLEHYKHSSMMATATMKLVSLLLFNLLLNMSEAAVSSNEIRGDKLPSEETDFKCVWSEGRVSSCSSINRMKHHHPMPN